MIQFFKKILFLGVHAAWVLTSVANAVSPILQVGQQSVVLQPGQTVRVPLLSNVSPSGDLTASGAFQNEDVTFTDGPECHLTAHDCTLWITAAKTSKDYTAVPVVVSESAVKNTPVFAVSVVHPGEPTPSNIHLPSIASIPITLSTQEGSGVTFEVKNTTSNVLTHVTALGVPLGITSSTCPTLMPGANCTLRLAVNHTSMAGHSVISIQSDQGLLLDQVLSLKAPVVVNQKPLSTSSPVRSRILTSGSLSAVVEPHGISTVYYASSSNGPVYELINITNNGAGPVILETPAISGTDASSFSIDTTNSDYVGNAPTLCNTSTTLEQGSSCEIMITSRLGDPTSQPVTAILTISDGVSADTLTFTLTDTTYVYAAGGFNALGNASVSGGDLLAECTAGTCSNALQGTTGNNYATNDGGRSNGNWINALAVTPTGNLMVGGVFGAIGGATSGATSGTAALLAQCTPGSTVTGDACINQIGISSIGNYYAFSNAYIDAITAPFVMSSLNYMAVGGDFKNIRNSSASGPMLAKCQYTGASANQGCSNYLGVQQSGKVANNAISAVDYFSSKVNVGGLFTQIAGYPSSAPSQGTTFASCASGACSQGMDANNPNSSILGMTHDGSNLYMGGAFTQAGGYPDPNGGYPLLLCGVGSPTTCSNALAGSDDANGYIEGLTYSGGNLYVGGKFTTIGTATPVSGGNMLAVCAPLGGCSNFVTDTQNYASGPDWGGEIAAVAVGNQTSITPN